MRKTTILFLVIIAVSLLSSIYITQIILQPTQQHTQAQAFLENVIGLDLTKYAITLQPTKKIPNLPIEYDQNQQKYIAKTSSNEIQITIEYENNKLARCRLRWLEEATQLANYSNDPLEIVKDFVKRYQDFSQESYMTEIEQILNQITTADPIQVISDSEKIIMDVIYREPYLYFQWSNTVKGICNTYNQVSIILRDNLLSGFSDSWNKYNINNVEVISRDQALVIAKQHVENYSYIFAERTISGFSILDNPLRVELSMGIKDENTVSPLWHIRLALAEVYPGLVTEIRVSLWADTGELVWINHAGP